jgi:FMN-dependent NADH-azoreductase
MSLFRLDAGIRIDGSASRAIADTVEEEWRIGHPAAAVTRRRIGTEPIPATAWADAISSAGVPESRRTSEQSAATALASALVTELDDAATLLLAVPRYNLGVSQHFKAYVDLVMTEPRMATGSTLLAGKPAVLATVQEGDAAAGAHEGRDHATGWMRSVLEDLWGLDLQVVARGSTLVGEGLALDRFPQLAA